MRAAATDRARRVRGLYAVTPDLADTPRLRAMVAAALDGGANVVQYRNKTANPAVQRTQARALAELCRERGALFIVNDDAHLAADVDADGVHVGEHDGAIAAARECVGPQRLVGVSCYDDPGLARAAASAGADYIAFGSFFASRVKPEARRAGLDLLRGARALGVPIVAIGGITRENAAVLRDAGADAVAVVSDVFAAGDALAITAGARAIADLFASPTSSTSP